MSNILGDRIRMMMYASNTTQRDVAKAIGCTEVRMSRILHGEREPNSVEMKNLCALFKCEPEFFGAEPERSRRLKALDKIPAGADEPEESEGSEPQSATADEAGALDNLDSLQAGIYAAPDPESNKPEPMAGDVGTLMVANMLNQLMRPLLENIGKLLQNNTEAMEQIATSQDVIRNRLDALEKQQRLMTPVTDRQAKYLTDAARERARDLLCKKGTDDRKAVAKLAGMIRKSVMARYGIGSLREVARCEYSVAMQQIEMWNNVMTVSGIVKEARERQAEIGGDAP